MDIFVQQIINGLVLGSMYALVALGYTMVYGIISLINFAHGEVLMVGAMVSWTVATAFQEAGSTLPGWLIMLISAIAAIVACAALEGGPPVRLTGPGIKDAATIAPAGLRPGFWDEVRANADRSPLGVDLVLVAGDRLIGLPRTIRVEEIC